MEEGGRPENPSTMSALKIGTHLSARLFCKTASVSCDLYFRYSGGWVGVLSCEASCEWRLFQYSTEEAQGIHLLRGHFRSLHPPTDPVSEGVRLFAE